FAYCITWARFKCHHNAIRLMVGWSSGVRQGLDQDYSVAGLPDVGRGDKVDVIDSWDRGAADREVYVSSTEHDWIHVQDERTRLPPGSRSCGMNSDEVVIFRLAIPPE